jgi:hypothetical protein
MEGSSNRLIRGNEVLSSNLPAEAEEGLGYVKVQRRNSAVRRETFMGRFTAQFTDLSCLFEIMNYVNACTER